ncbi:MAG: ComEC/Rec2 family competence protein [Hellea sp.]
MAEINSIIGRKAAPFMKGWSRPSYQDFDWSVAAFAVGIALYFALPFEPDVMVVAVASALVGLCVLAAGRFAFRLYPFVFILFLVLLGMGRSVWHTQAAATPKLANYERIYEVTGWVEAIERSGTSYRWRLRVDEIEGMSPEDTPKRVRVRAKTEGFAAGDAVTVLAVMTPPRGPVVPQGYDPGRRAYFEQMGGQGFGIRPPVAATIEDLSAIEIWKRSAVRFRYGLADRVRAKAPPDTAGLQAALLTGVRAYIPPEQTENLRVAGLAHVLAISGMHMGLLAGGSFWLAAFLLACISPLSRRYDVRKPAAIIGALAATGYLVLSGASVATQRAYIMAIIVFLAVILDRRAFSMRSVSVAALITLMLHPEALISVGFQMSFAAVAALVVVYGEWRDKRGYTPRLGFWQKIKSNFAGLTVTSFVAGTATSGFAVLHFNRIARYSLVGNVLAMPLFTFIVMPAALLTLMAMPFGLEEWPLAVMGWSLSGMLKIAEWVASWPGAMWHVSAAPPWVIGVFGFGFLLAALGQKHRRYLGFALAVLCLVFWSQKTRPDMRISDAGQVAFWDEDNKDILYVGRKRADRFGRSQFMQRGGQPESGVEAYKDELANCDRSACRFKVKGKQISVINHPSEVSEECEHSDIVVLTQREAGPVARRMCQAKLFDARVFKIEGAQDVYLEGKKIRFVPANSEARRRRPWS